MTIPTSPNETSPRSGTLRGLVFVKALALTEGP